ncbi:MAG TPA: hypothetical protein DCG67_14335, partial [Pseudomonas sp.]|nr:hypothetical protein [Pseudomonas sp.]
MKRIATCLSLLTFAWLPLGHAQQPAADPGLEPSTTLAPATTGKPPAGDWTAYGRDKAATRYSPLDLINRDNVAELKPVWGYRT